MVIINIGMPRSGTLWRYKLIRDLVIAGGGTDGVKIRKKYFLQPFISGLNADINTLSYKRLPAAIYPSILGETYVLNTHAHPQPITEYFLRRGRIKAIYGYRDPRDCILSMLEYSDRAKPQYSAGFLQLKDVKDAVKYMDIYLYAWEHWSAMPGTLVLKYENLLENFEDVVDQIIVHLELGISPKEQAEITERYLPQQRSKDGVATHFEKGVAHRFRQEFNQEELAYLAGQYAPVLERMGYEI